MQRMGTRGVAGLLVVLSAVAVAVNLYDWFVHGRVSWMLLGPTLGLLAMLLVLPFLAGWRPVANAADRLSSCNSCGTLWSPQLDGTPFCPACGGKTPGRAA